MATTIEHKSFLSKMLEFYERCQRKISIALMVLIIASWVSVPILSIVSYDFSLAFTTTVLTGLVMVMLDHLSSIKTRYRHEISIYNDAAEFSKKVNDILAVKIPKKVDLIEYSAASIREEWLIPLIKQNHNSPNDKTHVRLLICHPDNAISEIQRHERICASIRQLYHKTKEIDISGLSVKCYNFPASLRARNFDDQFVAVGWYTYRVDLDNNIRIRGDENPMIGASPYNREGRKILDLFKKCFDKEMWPAAKELKKVCGHTEGCKECHLHPATTWLEEVSDEQKFVKEKV